MAFFSLHNITLSFALLCSLTAFLIGRKNRHKFPELRYFYLCPLASFLQILSYFIVRYIDFGMETYFNVTSIGTNIFLLVEFLLFYHFFYAIVEFRFLKSLILYLTPVYLLSLLLYWIFDTPINYFPYKLFIPQAFLLLIPAFTHLLNYLRPPGKPNIFQLHSFWIVIGILLYSSCTLPIFLMQESLYLDTSIVTGAMLYSINYISYGILFILIAKAYLCPNRATLA